MKNYLTLIFFFLTIPAIYAQHLDIKILGPTSGVTTVAVHPQDGNVLFAGSHFGGIFKSTDGGISWRTSSEAYPVFPSTTTASSSVGKIVFDLDDKNILYACTGFDDTGGGVGILRSTDGGRLWSPYSSGIPNFSWVSMISINPRKHNEFYTVPFGSLYRSTDKGLNWSKQNGVNAVGPIIFDTKDSLQINGFSSDGAILESVDGGKTFNKYFSTLNSLFISDFHVDSTTKDIYFSSYSGLYKTSDKRNIVYLNPNFPIVDSSRIELGDKISRLAKIFSNPVTGSIFAGTQYGVFRSTDQGINWKLILTDGGGVCGWSASATICFVNGKIYVLSRDGVKMSTDDGETWEPISNGPPTSIIADLEYCYTNRQYWVVATENGVYTSSDSAITWKRVDSKLFPYATCVEFNPSNHSEIYVGLGALYESQQGLYKTTDAGLTWKDVSPQALLPVTAIAIHPDEPNIVYVGSPGAVWKSTNGGNSWQLAHVRPGPNETQLIKIAPSNPKILFVTATGNLTERTGIYFSEDGGSTWERRISGFPEGVSYTGVTAMAIHPTDPSIAFAGNWADGIYKTTDSGKSWSRVKNFPDVGFNNHFVSEIVIDLEEANILYANIAGGFPTSQTGMYKSIDGGTTWEKQIFNGVYNNSFGAIQRFVSNSVEYLFVGTYGGGIVNISSPKVTEVTRKQNFIVPDRVVLQSYPNPFNPSTNISFSIPVSGNVSLKIFDVLGREITTMANEYFHKDQTYTIVFNAKDLPSGIYFCKLESGGVAEMRKMILMK